jgi:nitrite reductase/ring-hydroxylating ferredoxin subunit
MASSERPSGETKTRLRRRGEKHVLCPAEEVSPGEVRGFRAGGRRVAVARLDDGTFRVLADVCPHQAAKMSDGSIERMWVSDTPGERRQSEERNVILCPWHGFEFDLENGGDPCVPGRPDLRLKTYPVEVESGEVVVCI